ncbi:carbohydrate ABC transporter permease, partial [Streptomyces sp. SID12501]
ILTGSASDLFLPALRNSVGICLIATAIAVVLASLCAYAVARLDFPGKAFVLGLSLAVSMFPVISIVTPLFNIWRSIGLYDTWAGLVIPYLSITLPLSIWTLTAFFREIPWEMEQAAQVDGATTAQAFRKVIVPLAGPGVATTAIIAFFLAWNDFVYGISLTSTEAARPVPAALAFFTGASQFEEPTGAISAAAVIVTIPVVVLVLLFQRQIVAGLTQGAVKG